MTKVVSILFFTFIYFTNGLQYGKHEKHLNESCIVNSDCMSVWSYCNTVQKKCLCIDGTVQDGDECKPIQLYCPSFVVNNEETVQKPGGPCQATDFDDSGFEMDDWVSNCSSTEFCFLHSNMRTADGKYFGHCCPQPELDSNTTLTNVCPTVSKTGGTCFTENFDEEPTCREDSHECVMDIPYEFNKQETCCPLVCLDKEDSLAIAGTGRCFNYLNERDPCEFSLQCRNDYKCVKNILEGPDPICQKEKFKTS